MNFKDWIEHQDREEWPWLLPGELIDLVMEGADMVETPSGHVVDVAAYLTALREKIGIFNQELVDARTRDVVAAVEARVRLFRDDEQRIMDGFHRIAIEGLRRTRYVGYGFKDNSGLRAIVPPGCWPRATVDWATGTVTADEERFTDVRFIEYAGQMPEVRFALNRDLRSTGMFVPYAVGEENDMAPEPEPEQEAPPVNPEQPKPTKPPEPAEPIYSTGAPGKPSSMHLVEQEMRRRAAAVELAVTLSAEAGYLEAWLRTTHSEAAPATAKTIRNRLGGLYRTLSGNALK
jgi:hypothetical protein